MKKLIIILFVLICCLCSSCEGDFYVNDAPVVYWEYDRPVYIYHRPPPPVVYHRIEPRHHGHHDRPLPPSLPRTPKRH